MEDKVKRESKTYIESLFKQNDKLNSGAITKDGMRSILNNVVVNFTENDLLEEVMEQYVKVQKYTTYNAQTKMMDVKYQNDAIDFPSAMAIVVKFLKKYERRQSDAFSGKGLIRFTDLPSSDVIQARRVSDSKRRLY